MSGLLQAFVDGLLNPLTTPAHVLTLLALSLLMALQPQRFVVLLIFALALAAGFLAIVLAVETTPARTVLLAVAAALGVMVAAAWAPKLLARLLAAIAGAALALDLPPQAVSSRKPMPRLPARLLVHARCWSWSPLLLRMPMPTGNASACGLLDRGLRRARSWCSPFSCGSGRYSAATRFATSCAARSIACARYSGDCAPLTTDQPAEDEARHAVDAGFLGPVRLGLDLGDILVGRKLRAHWSRVQAAVDGGLHQHLAVA